MKTLLIAIPALALMALPASALTLDQAYAEMGGYRIGSDGKTGTKKTNGTQTTTTPDTYVSTGVTDLNTPGGAQNCFTGSILDGPFEDGVRCSPAYTLAPGGGAYFIAGSSTTSPVCNVSTKVLTYNGPNTSRDTAWSVDSSSSSSSGAC